MRVTQYVDDKVVKTALFRDKAEEFILFYSNAKDTSESEDHHQFRVYPHQESRMLIEVEGGLPPVATISITPPNVSVR